MLTLLFISSQVEANQFSMESAVILHERAHSHEQHVETELENIHECSEKDTLDSTKMQIYCGNKTIHLESIAKIRDIESLVDALEIQPTLETAAVAERNATINLYSSLDVTVAEISMPVLDVHQSFAVSMDATIGVEMTSPEDDNRIEAAANGEALYATIGTKPTTAAPEKEEKLKFGIEASANHAGNLSVVQEAALEPITDEAASGVENNPELLNNTFGIGALPSVTTAAISHPRPGDGDKAKLIDLSFNVGTGQAKPGDNVLPLEHQQTKDSSLLIEAGTTNLQTETESETGICNAAEKQEPLNNTFGPEPSHGAEEIVVGNKTTEAAEALKSAHIETSSKGEEIADSNLAAEKPFHSMDKSSVAACDVGTVGYNLDCLDDPSFNPFMTKTGIRLSFGTSQVPLEEAEPQSEEIQQIRAAHWGKTCFYSIVKRISDIRKPKSS